MEKTTPKLVDLLEEDNPLPGQKFVCVSFVSPEKILKDKSLYFFEKFLKNWDFRKSLEKYNQFTNFLAYKYNLSTEDVQNDLKEFVKEEQENLLNDSIEDEYKNFIDLHEEKMENDFNAENDFKTNVRGVKVRGVFETQKEAEIRCKLLQQLDPNHDVYVGPVGLWMPWEPDAYKTGRVEHIEDELNRLMHEKDKNEKTAKMHFDKRVKNAKKNAIEENKKIALENNNKLTQNIDEHGNLFSVNQGKDSEVPLHDVRKELFDESNINRDRLLCDPNHPSLLERSKSMPLPSTPEEENEKSSSIDVDASKKID